MSDPLTLLDQALEIGRKELGYLVSGEVEQAESAASDRNRLMDKALNEKQQVDLDSLLDKLQQLKSLNGRITTEAKKLHSTLKEDLINVKKQNKRISGYAGSMKITPLSRSRFISKDS